MLDQLPTRLFAYQHLEAYLKDKIRDSLRTTQFLFFGFSEKGFQALLHSLSFGHVHECDHHPVDLVVNGAIRAHSQIVPAILAAANLTANRSQVRDDSPSVLDQIIVLKLMGKIGYRSTFVACRDAEQFLHLLGKPLDGEAC